MSHFILEADDKRLSIRDEDDPHEGMLISMLISIDYDDVDHPRILREARRLVRLLNKHWSQAKRAQPADCEENDED